MTTSLRRLAVAVLSAVLCVGVFAATGIGDVTPNVQVVKTVSPASMEEPGGTFTFTLVVTNTGPTPVTITTLNDDVYGNVGSSSNPNVTNNTCGVLIGDVLQPGESSAPCSFRGQFTGVAGASQTDVVTVVVVDASGNTATGNDDAVVTLTPRRPPPSPTSKAQCMNGGWKTFGTFKNQGDCVSFVASKQKNPPAASKQRKRT